jgi:hypothetical protein
MNPRKGVSEIVASIVILVVVSVLGVLLYNTSLMMVGTQQNALISEIDQQTAAARERFEIISVEYVDPATIKVYLLNFSPDAAYDIILSQVYVNGFQTSFTPVGDYSLQKNVIKIITITANVGVQFNDPNPSLSYHILVVSSRGVSNAYAWKY